MRKGLLILLCIASLHISLAFADCDVCTIGKPKCTHKKGCMEKITKGKCKGAVKYITKDTKKVEKKIKKTKKVKKSKKKKKKTKKVKKSKKKKKKVKKAEQKYCPICDAMVQLDHAH